MRFRCINNTDVEDLLTVGKVYAGISVAGMAVHVFRCDDKQKATLKIERFEEVLEDLVPAEPTTTIWEYTVEGKEK